MFQVNASELEWSGYEEAGGGVDPGAIRFKVMSRGQEGAPHVQLVEYAPGHADPVHRHDVGEVMIILAGSASLDDVVNGPGSVVYIAPGTDYALVAGEDGATFYRIVIE